MILAFRKVSPLKTYKINEDNCPYGWSWITT